MTAYMTIQSSAIKNSARQLSGLAGENSLTQDDFLALYDSFYSKVYNYHCYRCGDVQAAEDLTSQTFERALDYLASYRSDRAPFGAWLFAIARNLANDHIASAHKHNYLELEHIHQHASDEPSPEDHMIRGELEMALLAALESLDDRERDLLALKFGGRFTNRRIAAITGLSEANVGVIVHRSIQRIRLKLLEKEALK